MDRRVIVGAVAVLVLAGTLVTVLVFQSDNAEVSSLEYPVSWPVQPGAERTKSGELQENESAQHKFELSTRNVTRIAVTLEWTDDGGDPDKFELSVQPPDGEPRTNASKNETIQMTFERAEVPTVENFMAPNRSAAHDSMTDRATSQGQGNWSVEVTLTSAPGQRPIDDAPDLETEPDGSNSYELTLSHEAYRGELGEARAPGAG